MAASLLAWVGRFVFLVVFYLFLYRVFRTLVDVHGRATSFSIRGTEQVARLTFAGMEPEVAIWVEDGPGNQRPFVQSVEIVPGVSLTLGRAEGNRIRTTDPRISQHHFVIRHEAAGYVLHDLSTTNGTYVNGTPVHSATLLPSNCTIDAGALRFHFEVTSCKSVKEPT